MRMSQLVEENHLSTFKHKRSDWGLWFHMHEHVQLSMRARFLVHWRANWRMFQARKILALSSLIALAPSLLFALLLWIFDPFNPRKFEAHPIDLTVLLGVIGGMLLLWLVVQHLFFVYTMNRYYAPFVRREITAFGMPMCQACGHRLASMKVERCSECGTELQPNNF